MFQVESIDQGFMGKRARLRAVRAANDDTVVALEVGSWASDLRAGLQEGDVVTVNLPASLTLEVGQKIAVSA
jgi:hypothetical protein